jgi:hypothetical protein
MLRLTRTGTIAASSAAQYGLGLMRMLGGMMDYRSMPRKITVTADSAFAPLFEPELAGFAFDPFASATEPAAFVDR